MSRALALKRLFAAAAANDLDRYQALFAEDAIIKIGNAQPHSHPINSIAELAGGGGHMVRSVTREVKRIWEVDNNVVLCDADITYNRIDGKVFTFPALLYVQFKQSKIQLYQLFINASPVFAATALEKAMMMEASAFRGDWKSFTAFLAEDIYFKVGSSDPLRAPELVRDYYVRTQQSLLRITGAEIRGTWNFDNVAVVEMDVHAERVSDGTPVVYPSVDIFRFKGDQVHEWRIYPVYPLFITSVTSSR